MPTSGPAVADPDFACTNDDCDSDGAAAAVMPVDGINAVYPSANSIRGYPPADDDVTHVCVHCGMWYYGIEPELQRRLDAQREQHEAQVEAATAAKYDDYGWVEQHYDATAAVVARVADPTPYDWYRILLSHVYADRGPLSETEHADIVHHWVPHVGREMADTLAASAIEKLDVPEDLVERPAAEFM